MEIGLCLPQLGGHVSRNGLRAFCERAEELGYGSLWVQEHIFYPLNPVSGYSARPGLKVPDAYRSTLSALETLAAAAAWTCRPVVGTHSRSSCPPSTCCRRGGWLPASAWAGPTRSIR
jgi:alkanesulfonate monooxygenase SsuD/methylene tetrahydromethanopterin reductase-like flavin-dependent oxidoreductase (luciferase family)